ncbi:molybdopterin synthase subunit MoaE [Rhodothalassium salexigens DSM 2132]|uniref:Molybdopterin synthase catalytic subunit n=1 Tax=Rhodothalassium salexigens DSM 2132 TaxID=1188247 RepID=A0A4R2P9M3_RHOSA|nr:molybdenum cofactor biosynthesis protein MoaE [Rhodothalassium salexigens]MBB4212631.1 molybdopterin synthase catalytic subunit [Rhodothalassium salexigens DSM 2132]MBK1638755.1 molybdopterin synthase catalytic subunit [Rhodothalassium salexigens DSM 2132]TCP30771.1 molybdopterin synthase subunit MoaE [Rhodothalassium salexigens DSM 2132]
MITARVTDRRLDTGAELAALDAGDGQSGALVSFTGQVRADDGLTALTLEHYPGMTERALTAIAERTAARFALTALSVAHRVGRMAVGETIVVVVAAAGHRRAAFDGAAYVMDRLKTDAPFWKCEEGPWGRRWVEPRPGDDRAAARWADRG